MMTNAEALSITLYGEQIGIATRYTDSATEFVFDPDYVANPNLYTVSLAQFIEHDFLNKRHRHHVRLSPWLSNLLPEGALRRYYLNELKTHEDDDFSLLAYLGKDLPGALIANAITNPPKWAINHNYQIDSIVLPPQLLGNKFSLAGVQMKFSSDKVDGRFNIGNDREWIIKTPSTLHPFVPENEYSSMRLAQLAGINIPEIELISLSNIDNLPEINLPNEQLAYAIKRFDRNNGDRIHMEDFAQIFNLYPHNKYKKINYEQIGRALNEFSSNNMEDVQQLARRLLVNILLGNADAHQKNWSVLYTNKKNPTLSPAYDIVSTLEYIKSDRSSALNMGKVKQWNLMSMATFHYWAERIGINKNTIQGHLDDVLDIAENVWPKALEDLPMKPSQRLMLLDHSKQMVKNFKN